MSATHSDPCLTHLALPGTRPSVGQAHSTCTSLAPAASPPAVAPSPASSSSSSPTAVGAETPSPFVSTQTAPGEFSRLHQGCAPMAAPTLTSALSEGTHDADTTTTPQPSKNAPFPSNLFPSPYIPSSPPVSPMKPTSRLSSAFASAAAASPSPPDAHPASALLSQQQPIPDRDSLLLASAREFLTQELKNDLSTNGDPMHATYVRLALRALDTLAASPNWRITVVVAGIPGSGKSTLAAAVSSLLNKAYSAALEAPAYTNPADLTFLPNTPRKSFSLPSSLPAPASSEPADLDGFAATVTMDGYHLTRAQLDQFPDPAQAHARRGSPWTFDAQGVVDMAQTLRASCIPRVTSLNDNHSAQDYFSCLRLSSAPQPQLPMDIAGLSPPSRMLSSTSSVSSLPPSSKLLLSHQPLINNIPIIINNPLDNASSQRCHLASAVPSAADPTPTTIESTRSTSSPAASLTLPVTPGRDDDDNQDASHMATIHPLPRHQHLPPPLYFPSFDHAVKDPTPNGIEVAPGARIVLLEGLYLLYNTAPWNQIAATADDSWMLHVDVDVAARRLAARHLAAGIVGSLEQGLDRVRTNDELNARLIQANTVEPHLWIQSVSHN